MNRWLSFLFLVHIGTANALTVIGDFGGVEISKVMDILSLDKQALTPAPFNPVEIVLEKHHQESKLIPGVVSHFKIKTPFAHRLFVVGDDEYSINWLKANLTNIKGSNAIGIGINIKSKERFDEIGRFLGRPLLAVDIDELAAHLGIKHYPFAIIDGEVVQ